MKLLLMNIMLALLWAFMWGQFDIYTILGGFFLGYILLGILSRIGTEPGMGQDYGTRGWRLFSFLVYFVRIMLKANLVVAWEVLTPRHHMTPRFIRYPIEGLDDLQVTSLANLITLTPGTLSADISDDRRYIYIHCMYAKEIGKAVEEIDELRDRMLKELFACPI